MQKHAGFAGAMQLQFEDAQKDVGRQLNQMQNFISAKSTRLSSIPVDTDATSKMTKLAAQAGIPLVYVNRVPADWKIRLPPQSRLRRLEQKSTRVRWKCKKSAV